MKHHIPSAVQANAGELRVNRTVREPHDVQLGFLTALGSWQRLDSGAPQINTAGCGQVWHNMVSPLLEVLLIL